MAQIGELASETFHAAVGRALMRWRLVEQAVFRALVVLLAPVEPYACAVVWGSHRSIEAQISLVDALVKTTVANEGAVAEWRLIKSDLDRARGTRNRFAHSDTSFIALPDVSGDFALTDPRGRDLTMMTQASIETASRDFQRLANRIDALLSPTPRLRAHKPPPPVP